VAVVGAVGEAGATGASGCNCGFGVTKTEFVPWLQTSASSTRTASGAVTCNQGACGHCSAQARSPPPSPLPT
jgi:hypothetical protein